MLFSKDFRIIRKTSGFLEKFSDLNYQELCENNEYQHKAL